MPFIFPKNVGVENPPQICGENLHLDDDFVLKLQMDFSPKAINNETPQPSLRLQGNCLKVGPRLKKNDTNIDPK